MPATIRWRNSLQYPHQSHDIIRESGEYESSRSSLVFIIARVDVQILLSTADCAIIFPSN